MQQYVDLYTFSPAVSLHHFQEAVQKMLDEAESQLENGGTWMNPEAPVKVSSENFGTERDVANCPFFLKTGACRFGDRCSRKHVHPTESPTLLIRGMFRTFGMEESRRDDYDIDAWLEHSEEDLQETFLDFYRDVLPELRNVGKVLQFKVSCNYETHLRGNVYVQFDTEEQCKEAFIKFNGRWYAGRQLHCELCPVTRWKNAICGLFDRQKCPKGKHCNFLHVFRNPGNEFWEADRDLHLSPDRSVRGSQRDGWRSDRHRGDRSWRQPRHGSRSPPRSERSERSRSRREGDRRDTQAHREDQWTPRSRHSDRRSDWSLSRSTDRSRGRSRDRDRERDRQTDRSRSRERDRQRKHRNRSEERDRETDSRGRARERSRSSSRERERKKNSREKSPSTQDNTDKPPNDETEARHRRHKASKKSKKKSKKKHKRRRHLSGGMTSSGESEKETEAKEETAENVPAATSQESDEMPSGEIQTIKDSDQSPHVDRQEFILEVKGEESTPEIPSEHTEKRDMSSS